jgi:lipoate-protein ligase A
MPAHDPAGDAVVQWQFLPTLVNDGFCNMALDHAMAARVRDTGLAMGRVYGWSHPVLSLGRHQRAAGLYDRTAAREHGIGIVRRPTGGRAVLHFREITYCVAAPEHAFGPLTQAYRTINELLVLALRRLGVDATVATPGNAPPRPFAGACFEEPVAGEIVASGRKLVGSAQWRSDGALLQHGSILIDDDQHIANDLLVAPAPPPPRAATLRELLGRAPELEEFDRAFACAVAMRWGRVPERVALDGGLVRRAEARRAHYASDGWTWRR